MEGIPDILRVCCNTLTCDVFFTFFSPAFLAILGARPSKRRIGNDDNSNDNRRRKKVKAKSTVLSGAQVIDLVDDVPAGSTTSRSATSSTLPSASIPQNPLSVSIASPSSCLDQQVLLAPAIIPVPTTQFSPPPPSHQSEAFSTSVHIPVESNAPTPSSNISNPSSSLSPPVPSGETLPSQSMAGESSTITISVISSPPAADTAPSEQGQQVQPRWVNDLSQIAHRSLTDR